MFKNYFKIAFRNILRNKTYSAINIACLAVGMACTILLMFWVQDELSFDGFNKNADTIFHVHKTVYTPQREFWTRSTSGPIASDLKGNYSEIVNTSRLGRTGELVVRYRDKMFVEKQLAAVDPAYFEMFTVPFIKGDSASVLSQPNSIVLTEALAAKYFGDVEPLGKVLQLNNRFDCVVSGVVENLPLNTFNKIDAFLPFSFLEDLGFNTENYRTANYFTYVQLKENINIKFLNKRIFENFSIPTNTEETVNKFYLIPLTEVRFFRNMHQVVVYVFTVLAGVILLIACINYVNLSTAQALTRTKEVGIRKVVGATKSQLGFQFLGESLWLTLLALGLALVLVELVLPGFNHFAGKQIVIDYSNLSTLLSLCGIGLLTGFLAGGYPAIFLAAFKPTAVLKKSIFKGAKGNLSRKILVVTQFSFAIILIISTIYLYKQIDFLQNSDFGFEDEQVVFTYLKGDIRGKYESVKRELLQHPQIENVTAAFNLPFDNGGYTSVHDAVNPENSSHAVWDVVDPDYLQTFKMKLIQGRFFSLKEQGQTVVMNESLVKALRLSEPVGQSVILNGTPHTVIGVVQDFHNRPLVYPIEPMILTSANANLGILFAKMSASDKITAAATLNDIKTICAQFSPDYPLEYHYLAGFSLEGTDDMQAAGRVLLVFTVLGIGISCLGLYGLSLFLTEQRKKEVGIRKVLGSSVGRIILLFSKEYVLLIALANIIAWPLAWLLVNRTLQSAYRADFSFRIFLITGVSVVLLALLTMSYRAVRTALANPVEALRYE